MSTSKNLLAITSKKQFDEFCMLHRGQIIVALFTAPWSEPSSQLCEVLTDLDGDVDHSKVALCTIQAETVPEVSLQFKIVAVPTVVFIKDGTTQVERINGAYPADVVKKVQQASAGSLEEKAPDITDLQQRLKNLTTQSKCVLFIKGSPDSPQCGFSNQLIQLFKSMNVEFTYFDILSDENVRQGLKEYSKWPTYPQIYVDGKLLGGLDVIKEMAEMGELEDALPIAGKENNKNERLKSLVNKAPVMIFMKGDPAAPKCKFSKALMEIMAQTGVKFDTFDILSDNDVREGLKKYSNWPTYPQIYVNGTLIGGLDIVKELQETDELVSTLSAKA